MFILFSRIILSHWRSLLVLLLVLVFSATTLITLGQIVANVERAVSRETRPLFGADLVISPRGYDTGDILPIFAPYLSGEVYQVAERRKFSTTLIDTEGKTGLVQVVAYSGSYPQRGILEVEGIDYLTPSPSPKREGNQTTEQYRVAATSGLIERFASGGVIILDSRELHMTEKILESSDLGFALGTDNHLLMLPSSLLSGSLLLSSGSRLDHDLLVSFSDERRAEVVAERIRSRIPQDQYRIRTYEERTERNLDTLDILTDYITLIILLSSVFAYIILRSSHEHFFVDLSRVLRITHILGLTYSRQRLVILLAYLTILPLACILAIGFSYGLIELLRGLPRAADFVFVWESGLYQISLVLLMVGIAWFPTWWGLGGYREIPRSRSRYAWLLLPDVWVPVVGGMVVMVLIFENPLFALGSATIIPLVLAGIGYVIRLVYRWIYRVSGSLRDTSFFIYDGIRTIMRPGTPSISVTLSLFGVSVFCIVFVHFSLAFENKLTLDTVDTPNIYAINILPNDVSRIDPILGTGAQKYDIIRARILAINTLSLATHLKTPEPSGEFTREFSITTTPLRAPVIRGSDQIRAREVSVDEAFAQRLGVDIGDVITFSLSGKNISLTVANIRASIREGFSPFFYFSVDADEFRNAPRTYFAAANVPDIETWKQQILRASGPHVTFIDVGSILVLARSIGEQILSVISLFFLIISIFAIGAVLAFFQRMQPVESMKTRLYRLFGANPQQIGRSLMTTRMILFGGSYILATLVGNIAAWGVLSIGGFFEFSLIHTLMIMVGMAGVYGGLLWVVSRR